MSALLKSLTMTIQQALQALDGRPDLFAVRPSGKIISCTNRSRLLQHGNAPRPYHFTPMRSDIMTDDWQVKTLQQLQKEADAAMALVERQE